MKEIELGICAWDIAGFAERFWCKSHWAKQKIHLAPIRNATPAFYPATSSAGLAGLQCPQRKGHSDGRDI